MMLSKNFLISISAGAIIGLLFAVLGYFLYDLRRRFSSLFRKKMPEDYAEMLAQLAERAGASEKEIASLQPRIETLEHIAKRSFQKIGFMRFNPFADTGGDQSFALALLDHEDNGIVISSLYSREGTRIYAKMIDHGAPKQALSDEEKEVLARAVSKN